MNRQYSLIIVLLLSVFALTFWGCESKSPLDGVEVKLRAPFTQQIFDENDAEDIKLEVDAEPIPIVSSDYDFSTAGSMPKSAGKSKEPVARPNDTGIIPFPTGLMIDEFINNYLNNPQGDEILLSTQWTNNSASHFNIILYLSTASEQVQLHTTLRLNPGQQTLTIPYSALYQHRAWLEARKDKGLYIGVQLIGNPPYTVILNDMTLKSPPFIYIHRIVDEDDLDSPEFEDFDIDDLKDLEVEEVDLTGIIHNKSNSKVILLIRVAYYKNATETALLEIERSLEANERLVVEGMEDLLKDTGLNSDDILESLKTAVTSLFDYDKSIEFEVFCYSEDSVSAINVSIEQLSVNAVALISQEQ